MSDTKINVNAGVNAALAAGASVAGKIRRGSELHADKITELQEKASPHMAKVAQAQELLYTIMGFVLLIHGSQFPHLFLCVQVIYGFCFGRVKSSIVSLYDDMKTAWSKTDEGEDKDDTKDAGSKEAQKRAAKKEDNKSADKQRAEDVANAKKVLKVVNADKVTGAVWEVCISIMACHMVMEGGMAKVAVVTHVLVKSSKDRIKGLLDLSSHDDLEVWLDLFLSFVLYSFFAGMALVFRPLAFALNLGMIGSQLVLTNGLKIAEARGKIPGGESADAFAGSVKGLAVFAALAASGTLWQFWAIMAESSVAWYFHMLYLPAFIAEGIVSLL